VTRSLHEAGPPRVVNCTDCVVILMHYLSQRSCSQTKIGLSSTPPGILLRSQASCSPKAVSLGPTSTAALSGADVASLTVHLRQTRLQAHRRLPPTHHGAGVTGDPSTLAPCPADLRGLQAAERCAARHAVQVSVGAIRPLVNQGRDPVDPRSPGAAPAPPSGRN